MIIKEKALKVKTCINAVYLRFICSRIVLGLISKPNSMDNLGEITPLIKRDPITFNEDPGLTISKCVFHPSYNALYHEDGSRIECSVLRRRRENYAQNAPGKISPPKISDTIEQGIYGGLIFGSHFGHFVQDTLARLWPLVEEEFCCEYRKTLILFRGAGHGFSHGSIHNIFETGRSMLDQLQILDRIKVISQPILVEKMIIPHSAIVHNQKVHDVFIKLTQFIGSELLNDNDQESTNMPSNATRIYISRSGLSANTRRYANEKELESRLRNLGFLIVSPERLTFKDQLSLYENASEVVGIMGSAFFSMSFVRNNKFRVCYLVEKATQGHTYDNIDAALNIDSKQVNCLYPHPLSIKSGSCRDMIIDVDAALEGIQNG